MTVGKIRGLVMAALCAAICVFVVGCGSGGGDSGATATTSSTTTASAGAAEKSASAPEGSVGKAEKPAGKGGESGVDGPEPSGGSGSPAAQIDGRLKAAGYAVELKPAAPKTVASFEVPFEGGPTEGGYSITAYVYESAADAAAELESFEAAFSTASPEAIEVRVNGTNLYLAAAGPGGAVPPGALEKFIKVAEGR